MSFTRLVHRAIDAAGLPGDSPAIAYALDRVGDVGAVAMRSHEFAVFYKRLRNVPTPDPETSALNLVILAIDETRRGVRCVLPGPRT